MSRPNKLIQFYLTNMCNSRCKTCDIWKTERKNMLELPASKVIEIIREFPNADYVFGGGEFTLYNDKHVLLEYCDKNNVNYTILTNAVRLNLVEQLLALYDIKNLTISCDGKKHDEIRGIKGNLENIITIIKKYKDKIPNIKLSYTLSKFNENNIVEDMTLFKTLGFSKIYFCAAQDMELLLKSYDKTNSSVCPGVNAVKELYEKYSDMLYDKDRELLGNILNGVYKKCSSKRDVHTIYTNGDVVLCQSYLSNVILGNIYQESFKDIVEQADNLFDGECPYNNKCKLVCQRRYDYEDRI